jgi:hypothetical protein
LSGIRLSWETWLIKLISWRDEKLLFECEFSENQEDVSAPVLNPRQSHGIWRAITIHHLPLDANPSAFYSLPIFNALATSANSLPVTKRTQSAATYSLSQLIQYMLVGPANPATPDGGQHTT